MSGYDHWKTTNPVDEWLGPEPAEPDAELRMDLLDALQGMIDEIEGGGLDWHIKESSALKLLRARLARLP
jgi:hypothetical protein